MLADPEMVERLANAAAAAVRSRSLALARDPRSLRAITIELELGKRGEVTEATAHVSRHFSSKALLGIGKDR